MRVASTVHKNEMLLEHRVDTATLEAANKAVRAADVCEILLAMHLETASHRERELAAWNWPHGALSYFGLGLRPADVNCSPIPPLVVKTIGFSDQGKRKLSVAPF
jgi:hypothetical protein